VEQGGDAEGGGQMSKERTKGPRLLELLMNQTVLFLLVGFVLFMAFAKPSFLAWWNIQNILIDVSIYGVVACGMTILIICGEFDLSASSQYMWAQILFVTLLNTTDNPFLSVVLTLCSGLILGTINGVIVTRFRINSFIATLGTMTMIRGLCLVFTKGKMVSTPNAFIKSLGAAQFLGLSSLFYIYLAVLVIISVMLAYTNFGRRIYATGGNIEVARLAGIGTSRQKTAAFSIMGLLCSIGGIMLVAELRAGSTQYGTDLALTCVAATVIGGTRLSGGAGNALRTALGMLVIVVLYKALIYLGLQAYYQNLVKGLVLILVVVFDLFVTRRRAMMR
jgi:ribose/xylose/arabinose/galactoside ABC-type transport system permease subunit